jgi:lipopolysaccharide transport system ATP-binding protein
LPTSHKKYAMERNAISVQNISKRYRLGVQKKQSATLAGGILQGLMSPINNLKRLRSMSTFKGNDEDVFWAVKDVSFDVKEGEVLGIIGHNGAGKSTLLKILSRITEPSSGEIKIKGRIAALLEVGTGFHPEMTGRENIFMNGTILGMTKAEITSKFDEIVSFSGVEKFIDTPVKFYSSGMKVRLGFAVAAHLDPEILIVDEVLAVGDLEFQRKCLGKMENVAGSGKTVLFVSHSMNSIKQLCTKCMVMHHGQLSYYGSVEEAIKTYVSESGRSNLSSTFQKLQIQGNVIELVRADVLDQRHQSKAVFNADEEIFIKLVCLKNKNVPGIQGYFLVRNESDEVYIESDTFEFLPNILDELPLGEHTLICKIPARVLPKGRFKVYLNFTSNFSANGHNLDSPRDVLSFEIYDSTTRRGMVRKAYTNITVQWQKV